MLSSVSDGTYRVRSSSDPVLHRLHKRLCGLRQLLIMAFGDRDVCVLRDEALSIVVGVLAKIDGEILQSCGSVNENGIDSFQQLTVRS